MPTLSIYNKNNFQESIKERGMGEVKVFGLWLSPFVKRVEMALKMKGVEYEYIEEDLQNKSPLLLQYNPVLQKVPVLVHNHKPIAESMIIVEYIDQVWKEGPPILPKDPYQRAMARFWVNFIDEKCNSTLWKTCWSKGEEHEKLKEEENGVLGVLENEIKGKKFFGGDDVGFVDIAANFIGYWVPIIGELGGVQLITQESYPNLWRWSNDYCNHNLVKDYLPNKGALIERFKSK